MDKTETFGNIEKARRLIGIGPLHREKDVLGIA
jgi:hypothetical protein